MSKHVRPAGLRGHIHDLYARLHEIGQSASDLGETESQEILGWALNHHFIYGPSTDALPKCYGLSDKQANMAVAEAIAQFLMAGLPAADSEGCLSAGDRCGFLQERCFTRAGGAPYDYDEFIGHADEVPPDYPAPTFIDIYADPTYPRVGETG